MAVCDIFVEYSMRMADLPRLRPVQDAHRAVLDDASLHRRYNPPGQSMTLTPGTRLGPYEIQAAIGAGGAPAAMPSRSHVTPRRGISVSSRRGWGPHDSPEAESLRSRPRNSEALRGVGVGPHASSQMLTLSPCRS